MILIMNEEPNYKQEEMATGGIKLKQWAKIVYLAFISFMLLAAATLAF